MTFTSYGVIAMSTEMKFTEIEYDALKETSNVGAGNASIALSEIINKKVNLVISDVKYAPLGEISKFLTGPQKLIVAIYTPISKGMSGNIMIMLEKENALALASEIEFRCEYLHQNHARFYQRG